MEKLKWAKPWGPKKFREVIEWLVVEVSKRTPIAGTGITVDMKPDGAQISVSSPAKTGDKLSDGGIGGGGGTSVDIYGYLNGQPAIFHLLQSAPPTQPPPP